MAKVERKIIINRENAARTYIGTCIAKLQSGESLPSIRELIRETGTSRLAVTQALEYYKKLNMIEVRPRSGTIKSGKVETGGRIVDVVACHETGYFNMNIDRFPSNLLNSLHAIASDREYALRMHQVQTSDGNSIRKYIRIQELTDGVGYILLLPQIRELVRFFEDSGKPVVSAFSQPPLRDIRQVVDSPRVMEILVDHLAKNGHSRIAYLTGVGGEWIESMTAYSRVCDYYRQMAERGFQVNPAWVFDRGENDGRLDKALEKIFASPPRPTAIIAANYLTGLYRLLEKHGYYPGKNISVAVIECADEYTGAMPGATILRSSKKEAAWQIWQMLEEQWCGDNQPKLWETPLRLEPGNSVINLNKLKMES